jgi:hypothetical protein
MRPNCHVTLAASPSRHVVRRHDLKVDYSIVNVVHVALHTEKEKPSFIL